MDNFFLNDGNVTNGVFLASLAIVLVWERLSARRQDRADLGPRWRANFTLMVINMAVVYVVFPVGAVGVALLAQNAGWGLFNQVQASPIIVAITSVLVMDLWNYVQHYLMHRYRILWMIHRVHHADPACDATSSLRFHPFETIFSFLTDLVIIAAIGVPAVYVVLYRLARMVVSTLVHGNILIPLGIDRLMRYVLVTPDVHRVHHSRDMREHNSNFSGGLIWWDMLFGTYIEQPESGHRNMEIGLPGFAYERATSLKSVLLEPFREPPEK